MSANPQPKFIRDLGSRSASDIINVVLNLAIIALVARSLAQGDFGIYTQIITVTSLLIPVFILRMNTACVRFFPTLGGDRQIQARQFTSVMILVVLVSLAGVAALIIVPETSSRLFFGDPKSVGLIGLLAAYVILRCLVTMLTDYFRAENRAALASWFNTLRFVLVLTAIAAAVAGGSGLEAILLAQLGGESVMLVLLLFRVSQSRGLVLSSPAPATDIQPYLHYCLPLVPYSLFLGINQFSDRFFITHLVGVDATGVYAFSYNLIAAAFLLNASISYVIYPHLCRLWEQGDMGGVRAQLELGQRLFLIVAIPATCGLGVVHRDLVSMVAGPGFEITVITVVSIAVGQLLLGLCSLFGFVIDLSRKTTLYLKVLFATASVNLLLNGLLVPDLGIIGAAVATALTYLLQLVLMWRVTWHLVDFPLQVDFRFAGLSMVAAGVMVICLVWIESPGNPLGLLLTVLGGVLVYSILALVLLREPIRSAVDQLATRNQ